VKALITGVTGQDGYYLAQLLLFKGYEVHGVVRWSSWPRAVPHGVITHLADMADRGSLWGLRFIEPDEVYNLASISSIPASRELTKLTQRVNAKGAVDFMRAFPRARFFQASSAQMGTGSPYAKSKADAHQAVRDWRELGHYAATGILHNHESPRHSTASLPRKVAAAARLRKPVRLFNVASRRDWGWAPDYVDAMWRTLQQPEPDDYEIGTGVLHSVADACEIAYGARGLDWRDYVTWDSDEGNETVPADTRKAREVLGWEATVPFAEMVRRL
jgi:GDPmannose 4,6-dehydratase